MSSVLPRETQSAGLVPALGLEPPWETRSRCRSSSRPGCPGRLDRLGTFPDRLIENLYRYPHPARPAIQACSAPGAAVMGETGRGVRYNTRSRLPSRARIIMPSARPPRTTRRDRVSLLSSQVLPLDHRTAQANRPFGVVSLGRLTSVPHAFHKSAKLAKAGGQFGPIAQLPAGIPGWSGLYRSEGARFSSRAMSASSASRIASGVMAIW